jgi:hypothetical protein
MKRWFKWLKYSLLAIVGYSIHLLIEGTIVTYMAAKLGIITVLVA